MLNIQCIRTDSTHPDFISMIAHLDIYLAATDGEEHAFYAPLNTTAKISYVIIAYDQGRAVGCGALKAYDAARIEIKRMYTVPAYRSKGVATLVLKALEEWAGELAYSTCILETGKRQPEAISLYKKCGYVQIPNYEPYVKMENSVCFEKVLPKNDVY